MKHAFVLGLTAALVTTPGFSRAFAQAPAATIQLPPVTVTAQKEPADPRTLPVSVTAVPKSTLTNAGVGIVSEAGQYSPNTFFTEFAARKLSNARFRGIGSSPANPGVTTYFDGVPQLNANTSSIDLLDVEQVEFVRGPQSALFGRNTLGGLVNVVSSRPSLSSWTGSFSAPFANAGSMEIRAGAGGPVVSGRMGASFAMVYGQRDGYTTNVITGNDLDSREAFAAKGQLLWTPSSTWVTAGRTSICGSTSPVGRTTCSTTWPLCSRSKSAGVADTNTVCGMIRLNSSNRSGRLSSAEGSLNPYSTRFSFRERSPLYIPPICGIVT